MTRTADLTHSLIILLTATALLTIIGLIFIYSASSVFALEHKGDATFYLKRQSFGIFASLLVVLVMSHIPSQWIQTYSGLGFFIALILTLLPIVYPSCSLTIHGSSRWLSLVKGYSFQPSELLKVTFIPCIASLLANPSSHRNLSFKRIIGVLLLSGCASIILLLQPDFGQAFLLMTTALCLAALTYQSPYKLFLLAIPIGVMGIVLIMRQPYRLRRIMTFLYPWDDPRGAGFQIIQSLIAIGSGGMSGVGIAQSQQKYFYLPMQHTDFIFSIISEETGFIGAVLIIILYLCILYSGIRLASHMRQTWQTITVAGITILISLEALINLAVTTGTAPTKGLGLPFVSYGISSLIGHSCMIGIIMACARAHQRAPQERAAHYALS